jgi:hypothetical protein
MKNLLKRPQNRKINAYFIIFIIQSFTIKKERINSSFCDQQKVIIFSKMAEKIKKYFLDFVGSLTIEPFIFLYSFGMCITAGAQGPIL